MVNNFEFLLLAFSSLIAVVAPVSTVPLFLSMTPLNTPEERIRMARLACLVACLVLLVFAVTGELIFKALGVTIEAFQIAGGVVLFLIALEMLNVTEQPGKLSSEERNEGRQKEDIAVTPLAVPLLAGPGAISTSVLLHTQTVSWFQKLMLYFCIVVVCALTYIILRFGALGAQWLNPIVLRIASRLLGLLLAAIAIQFVMNGMAGASFLSG